MQTWSSPSCRRAPRVRSGRSERWRAIGLVCLTLAAVACGRPTEAPRLGDLGAALASPDWATRPGVLRALEAYGPAANSQLIAALADPSDVVSATAQRWLIRQGHTVLPTLAATLAGVEVDRGLFARIAGGEERHRGKSIAATLWLTLVREIERDRCLDHLTSLIEHRSPRVRAVAVLTAVTLRSSTYLPILERAAEDADPLVKRTLRQGLVRLLQRASYSTPVLDAETEGRALDPRGARPPGPRAAGAGRLGSGPRADALPVGGAARRSGRRRRDRRPVGSTFGVGLGMEHPAITLVDQVHWAFSNVISSLEGAAWTVETGELIDILDGVIVRYGSPDPRRVEIVPSNNDFN